MVCDLTLDEMILTEEANNDHAHILEMIGEIFSVPRSKSPNVDSAQRNRRNAINTKVRIGHRRRKRTLSGLSCTPPHATPARGLSKSLSRNRTVHFYALALPFGTVLSPPLTKRVLRKFRRWRKTDLRQAMIGSRNLYFFGAHQLASVQIDSYMVLKNSTHKFLHSNDGPPEGRFLDSVNDPIAQRSKPSNNNGKPFDSE